MSTMAELTKSEIIERCNIILKNLEEGKPPDANEMKSLLSSDLVSRNMRNPDDGPIGKFTATMMQYMNLKQSIASAERCYVRPGEIVLEIGTGGHGYAMEILLKTKGLQQLVGIEISDDLRCQVGQKFFKEIQNKELILVGTDCKDMSNIFPLDGSVDCILAVNVVYFLHPLEEYLQEMYRVLKPDTGRIILSCKIPLSLQSSDSENTSSVFKNMDYGRISVQCKDAGFKVDVENVNFGENSSMNDFTLIKLYKR